MSELAHRRPQSVADAQTVDYTKALNYLGLSPGQPAAQALILVCQRYDLDPLLGHVSIYEGKPYVHYAGYLHIGNSNPHYEGAECVREWEDDTYNYATVRVHRDDRKFYAERTGKSRKVKRYKDKSRGTYVDDEADAKAFAQAHRRALRLAFNVDHPDPAEDHGEPTPAPEPVVEVARMVENRPPDRVSSGPGGTVAEWSVPVEQTPGVGADAPEAQAGPESPAPGPTSGAGEGHGTASTAGSSQDGRFESEPPAAPVPGHQMPPPQGNHGEATAARTGPAAGATQSVPWPLAPPGPGTDPTSGAEATVTARSGPSGAPARPVPAGLGRASAPDLTSGGEPVDYPRQAVDAPPDQTSPPVSPGVVPGGDTNPPDDDPESGDAIPADLAGEGPEGSGEPDDTANTHVSEGGNTDVAETATTGPTPPIEQRSQVIAWCLEHHINFGDARIYLANAHKEHFGKGSPRRLANINDMAALQGEDAARALVYLDAQFGDTDPEGG